VCEQIADHELPQSAAATCDDDLFHCVTIPLVEVGDERHVTLRKNIAVASGEQSAAQDCHCLPI
jgi:hypothetical protein